MYFTKTSADQIRLNKAWDMGDQNPFSDSISDPVILDLTHTVSEGALFDEWWDDIGYTIFVSIQYYTAENKGYELHPHPHITYDMIVDHTEV